MKNTFQDGVILITGAISSIGAAVELAPRHANSRGQNEVSALTARGGVQNSAKMLF